MAADSNGSDSTSLAVIIGVVVAVTFLVILIVVMGVLTVVCFRLRSKTSRKAEAGQRNKSWKSDKVLLKGPQSVSNPNYEGEAVWVDG